MRPEDDSFAGNPELNGSDSLIVVSGCSGGDKSTLIRELAKRGHDAQPEAGRQIVKEQLLYRWRRSALGRQNEAYRIMRVQISVFLQQRHIWGETNGV